mmetsp:Transcript_13375/g.22770  ORF Transcript_13375/g.22770 Transcript_13375/m.22770 type:complete len:98 (-) Transcript_13375:1328-1621(-)
MRLDKTGEPIWSSGDFDLTFDVDSKNQRQLNLSIPLGNLTEEELVYSQMVTKNASLNLYFQVMTPDIYSPEFVPGKIHREQPLNIFRNYLPLVKYMK